MTAWQQLLVQMNVTDANKTRQDFFFLCLWSFQKNSARKSNQVSQAVLFFFPWKRFGIPAEVIMMALCKHLEVLYFRMPGPIWKHLPFVCKRDCQHDSGKCMETIFFALSSGDDVCALRSLWRRELAFSLWPYNALGVCVALQQVVKNLTDVFS